MKKQVHQHETHIDISRRLKRAKGHINKIIEMIEALPSCLDIALQLHAVEKAVIAAKKTLIHDLSTTPRTSRTRAASRNRLGEIPFTFFFTTVRQWEHLARSIFGMSLSVDWLAPERLNIAQTCSRIKVILDQPA